VAPREPTVSELAAEARRGDRAAYALLYRRMRGAAHAVVLSRVPPADAADLVQDTFVAAWTRIDELRDDAAFPGWVLEIARRRAVDHTRRRRSQGASRGGAGEIDHLGVDPVPRAEAEEAMLAIRALPDAYRETLVMRLVEGMTGPEIAQATGLAPESVRVNLCRGMKLLRERLEKAIRRADAEEREGGVAG
jgi:RNA polymerase sigma-70 factor (ECF subfamily)